MRSCKGAHHAIRVSSSVEGNAMALIHRAHQTPQSRALAPIHRRFQVPRVLFPETHDGTLE